MWWKEFATREARFALDEWAKRFKPLTLPVPVEDIADLMCELAIDTTDSLPPSMAGRLYALQRIIEVRQDDGAPRQRFTIAHEIGHYRLHVLAERLHLTGFVCSSEGVTAAELPTSSMSLPGFTTDQPVAAKQLEPRELRRIEIEANTFAAELLMPAPLVEQAIEQYGKNISTLASKFAVSHQAMQYRMQSLLFLPPPGPQTSFL
jgi:DNA helicase II / ATP-dependent DNA helicase PcrA